MKETENANNAYPDELLIGKKIGNCDLCKVTKNLLLLKCGFNLCEDCLNICTSILDQLEQRVPIEELEKNIQLNKFSNAKKFGPPKTAEAERVNI